VNTPTTPQKRNYSTEKTENRLASRRIVLPMTYEQYEATMSTSQKARNCLTEQIKTHPELFPAAIAQGYKFNGWTEVSKKMPDMQLRRIRLSQTDKNGQKLAYTIAPCDVLPYMTGVVSDVEKGLFLKQFGVPDWALTYVLGRNDSYWYRQTEAFGRYNLVGCTVKEKDNIPKDLLADEKHAKAHGGKWYVGTTVAQDCVLGASVSTTADTKGLTDAYRVFKQEAQAIQPQYQPETVNTDGWAATSKAWRTLFPSVVIILCFLHAFIKIRSRCKRLGEYYEQIKQQVWEIYHAVDRDEFNGKVRSLQNWVLVHRRGLTTYAMESIDKLCQRADQFCLTFDYPTAYRTSNMLDRHMEPMARWLAGSRYFHGNLQSAELRTRAWALLHNYRIYCPRAKVSDSFRSPAHKLNGFIYRDNWLENLLVASSCQGFRLSHKKRLN
jgi:hypothetical protein